MKPSRRRRPAISGIGGRRGSVFVLTLWALFLLSTMALSLGVIVRQKLTLTDRLSGRDDLRFIATAGVNRGIAELRGQDLTPEYDSLQDSWAHNPLIFKDITMGIGTYTVVTDSLDDAPVRYGLMDEESKININTADPQILTRLLQRALPQEEAAELAYRIKDWSDADPFFQHPRYGAEDGEYKDLKDPYEAKDAAFEIIDELLLVIGVTEPVLDKIRAFVTIHGQGGININTASAPVLEIAGLDSRMIELILAFRKGEDLTEGTADDNVFKNRGSIAAQLSQYAPMTPSELAELSNLDSQGIFVTRSDYFRIHSIGRLNKGTELEITAVVDRQGQIQSWREKY